MFTNDVPSVHLTSLDVLISLQPMRLLIGLIRLVIFVIPMMLFLFVIAAITLVAGTLFFLLSGRRPRFQVRTANWQREPSRPSMKDVTPQGEPPELQNLSPSNR